MQIRVGKWTTGITLVLIGIAILLSQISDIDGIELLYKLWPLVLIGYGVEYLLATRSGEKRRFDVTGISIVAIAFFVVFGFSIVGSFGFIGSYFSYEEKPLVITNENYSSINVSTLNGSVKVQPSTDNQIYVYATYGIPAMSEKQALERKEEIEIKTRTSGETLHVDVDFPKRGWFRWSVASVDLTLEIPAHLAVGVKTSNGVISITGMEQINYAKTSNGEIVVVDSKGEGTVLDTSNGRVEVTRFSGGLTIDTSNGKIIVVDSEVTDDWDLKTSNGAIDVQLRGEHSYDYSFTTSNGKIHAATPPFLAYDSDDKKVKGSINGGKYDLELRTSNGSITVNVR